MGDKIKVIMDCDPGIDDGIALAYAAAHQDELELLAVTTSAGSTRIERVTSSITNTTSYTTISMLTTMALSTILNELEVILLTKVTNLIGISATTI